MSRTALFAAVLMAATGIRAEGQAPKPARLEIKYVRDSEEYWTLTHQIYRLAVRAVQRAREALPAGTMWGVIIDVDETTLDNSIYELDRASYGLAFDTISWNGWVRREDAAAVPGAVEFIRAVRAAGGRVAYISGREEKVREATRRNLQAVGLWADTDRLCLLTPDATYTKARRRAEVGTGQGQCAWSGLPVTVVAYIGDQMGDFPTADEENAGPEGRAAAFGTRYFLLPNPMYGSWTTRVTRPPD